MNNESDVDLPLQRMGYLFLLVVGMFMGVAAQIGFERVRVERRDVRLPGSYAEDGAPQDILPKGMSQETANEVRRVMSAASKIVGPVACSDGFNYASMDDAQLALNTKACARERTKRQQAAIDRMIARWPGITRPAITVSLTARTTEAIEAERLPTLGGTAR